MSYIFSPNVSLASVVSAEIDSQIFRDFAENKGVFKAGATDIAIYNKKNERACCK
ncbi:hypothetical protein HBA43_21110 [Providencia rettgeri]|uniref:S6 family peptidase n=1 Tax=Providencia rettgeri TaxID=587 RepID=UPI001419CFE8|nr:S6 family peptidase [Providencia rettgeri]NIA76641.1 hypothetical protein [Providencia rettgeri]NIA80881.1 hypothetical protein [Providencia rettgeri]NIB04116.1 hypothetical protein [Providencia rettgeri]NIB08318.1 hypothetical protein [Providencia rettgeri]NIB21928.1 hypothetical protein [Providencia rettgeri]